MSRILKFSLLALSIATVSMSISSPAAARACTKGICAESTDDGRTVNVYITTKLRGYTHYNVIRNGKQIEVRPGQSVHFKARKGYKQYYSVQVCNRTGDYGTRSSCTGWVRFYHTA